MKNLIFLMVLLFAASCTNVELDQLTEPENGRKSRTQKLRPIDNETVTLDFVFGCFSDSFFMDYTNLPNGCSSLGMDVEWITDSSFDAGEYADNYFTDGGHYWVFSFPLGGDCDPVFTEINTGTEFYIGEDTGGFESIGVHRFEIIETTESSIFVAVYLEHEGVENLCNGDLQYIGIPLEYECDC